MNLGIFLGTIVGKIYFKHLQIISLVIILRIILGTLLGTILGKHPA